MKTTRTAPIRRPPTRKLKPLVSIVFTQCCTDFRQDERSFAAATLPILVRLRIYEEMLCEAETATFFTLDEHMLLVAQWLKRKERIKRLQFVSVCDCQPRRCDGLSLPLPKRRALVIPVDADGDMLSDPHHGFFPQRLYYLR